MRAIALDRQAEATRLRETHEERLAALPVRVIAESPQNSRYIGQHGVARFSTFGQSIRVMLDSGEYRRFDISDLEVQGDEMGQ